jgi:hypothetical protein
MNTMKKGIMLLALALLAAGGVFAQKVGDTVKAGGKDYRVEEVRSDGRLVLQPVATLDGVWDRTVGGNNIIVITFSGASAVITNFAQNQTNAAWRNAQDKGFIKVGDPYIKNIQSTGATTWSCEVLELNTDNTGIRWDSGTITMQADKTIRIGIKRAAAWRVDFRKR